MVSVVVDTTVRVLVVISGVGENSVVVRTCVVVNTCVVGSTFVVVETTVENSVVVPPLAVEFCRK